MSEVRGRSVLVVDDERVVGRALQRLLGRRHAVEVLSDARDALAQLMEGRRYDVIFCDLMMPEMSGPRFYEELKRRLPEQVGRIVFMTGGAFSDEARRFLEMARRPCLEKPFDMPRLHALLEELPG